MEKTPMKPKIEYRQTPGGWSVSVYVDGKELYCSEMWPDQETARMKAEHFIERNGLK
jgi:hypothetical protein